MDEGPAALHRVLHVRKHCRVTVVLVILAADAERDAVAPGHHDAGRPDLDVELVHLARDQQLLFAMRVIRPAGQRARRIELAVGGTQPALCDGRVRIERPLEHHFLAGRIEHAQHGEDVRIHGRGRHEQLERDRTGDLGSLLECTSRKGSAFAHGLVGVRRVRNRRLVRQAHAARVEVEAGPPGTRERPFTLGTLDERLARMPHLQQHRGLPVPAVVGALEEMVEEALLQTDAVVGIERRPVRAAVHFQPLLLRSGAGIALEIAPGVQPLPAPVRRRQHRHRDARQVGAAFAIPLGVGLALEHRAPHVFAVVLQFGLAQRLGAAGEFSGDRMLAATLTDAMLHRLDLHLLPVLAEGAGDAAMAVRLAIGIVPALPGADRGQVRRLGRGDTPLVARVVGNAVEPDLAVAPGLNRRPFDAQVEVTRLARIVVGQVSRRAARTSGVDADADIAVRHPLLRIDHLPVLVLVGRAGERVRILARHDVPGRLVAFLEGEALAVRPVGHQHRVAALGDRPEDVGAQHQPVVHGDGHIPVDAHAVAGL